MKLTSQAINSNHHVKSTYLFSTENIDGYMGHITYGKKKSGVIVTASGDQIISAATHGIKNIAAFDYNRNAEFTAELKLAALQNLRYDEFIAFFTYGEETFDFEAYKVFRESMTPLARDYWDKTYARLNNCGQRLWIGTDEIEWIRKHIPADPSKSGGTYLENPQSYEKAQEATGDLNLRFLNTSIVDLKKHLGDEKFDIGVLSNISGHYNREPRSRNISFANVVNGLLENVDSIQAEYFWLVNGANIEEFAHNYSDRTKGKASYLRFDSSCDEDYARKKDVQVFDGAVIVSR